MVTQSWMYDAIIYIYALSLLFYFSDFLGPNQSAKRMGTGLLAFVWILQSGFLVMRFFEYRYLPIYTMFETLFFYSWLLVTISLVVNIFFRIDLFTFFVNVVGFSILSLNFFSDPSVTPIHTSLLDELLIIHISFAIMSYVLFLLSAIFSGMYLFLHHRLKNKQWTRMMKRLPSLDKIERYSYYNIVIGTPLLILSLCLVFIWMYLKYHSVEWLDFKIFSTFLILATYSFYLVQTISVKAPGNKLAIYNIVAFSFVILNFFISNMFSQFHQWRW